MHAVFPDCVWHCKAVRLHLEHQSNNMNARDETGYYKPFTHTFQGLITDLTRLLEHLVS